MDPKDWAPIHSARAVFDDGVLPDQARFLATLAFNRLRAEVWAGRGRRNCYVVRVFAHIALSARQRFTWQADRYPWVTAAPSRPKNVPAARAMRARFRVGYSQRSANTATARITALTTLRMTATHSVPVATRNLRRCNR